MSEQSYLIDTNVLIGLEDNHTVEPVLANFLQLAAKHKVDILVHEAARDDISRDKNVQRRSISNSKLEKFQTLSKVRGLTRQNLESEFGPLRKPNDVVDATLLHALRIGAADFLVTEDRGLHNRARTHSPELARRVLFVADARSLLRTTYEPKETSIRYVEEVSAHSIPLEDSIFDSLREGYPEFNDWWREKCIRQRRQCWVVYEQGLAGLIVRKDEYASDTDAQTPANKILKICTFKVRPESRGTKLGELLLKKVFWHAQINDYDLAYVTTYAEQVALMDLLEYYGFRHTYTKNNGELVFEKTFARDALTFTDGDDQFEMARLNYPRFVSDASVEAFGIPIREPYHDVLFPDLKQQADLFEGIGNSRKPGNTIRKVYLCSASSKLGPSGSILFFYKGRSDGPPSQALTAVGVFEDYKMATSTKELMQLCGGRSVYSEHQLHNDWRATEKQPVKVINFLLVGYLDPAISIGFLRSNRIFKGNPPQSIFKISPESFKLIQPRMNLGFAA